MIAGGSAPSSGPGLLDLEVILKYYGKENKSPTGISLMFPYISQWSKCLCWLWSGWRCGKVIVVAWRVVARLREASTCSILHLKCMEVKVKVNSLIDGNRSKMRLVSGVVVVERR